jgi:hypothetical protein
MMANSKRGRGLWFWWIRSVIVAARASTLIEYLYRGFKYSYHYWSATQTQSPQCLQGRRKTEWARSTDGKTGSKLMVDTDISPCEEQSAQLHRESQWKEEQQSDCSSPLSIFLLFFAEVITLLVAETDQYYHHCLDTLDSGPSPVPDVTEHEMYLFLAITIQVGHCIRDQLRDCWATMEQFYTPPTAKWSNETGTHTFFASYTSQTTDMKLTGQTKIMTDYGKYETYLKF